MAPSSAPRAQSDLAPSEWKYGDFEQSLNGAVTTVIDFLSKHSSDSYSDLSDDQLDELSAKLADSFADTASFSLDPEGTPPNCTFDKQADEYLDAFEEWERICYTAADNKGKERIIAQLAKDLMTLFEESGEHFRTGEMLAIIGGFHGAYLKMPDCVSNVLQGMTKELFVRAQEMDEAANDYVTERPPKPRALNAREKKAGVQKPTTRRRASDPVGRKRVFDGNALRKALEDVAE